MPRIQHPQLAGTWYAGDARNLRRQVDELLQAAEPAATRTPLRGVIVPHAGYIYSGRAAAAAYACLRATPYRRAVILAPSHFAAFRGVAVLDADAFETPLGEVRVDRDGVAALLSAPLFSDDPEPYREEHSLEIQLPLLQSVLPDVRVVPALLGDLTRNDQSTVAGVLEQLVDDETIVIVSSDFVHYGSRFGYLPFPAAGPEAVRARLRELDMGAVDRVRAGDAAGFRRYVADTGATICGRTPISVFLTMHAARTVGQLLTYYTSLDVTGDYEHCVSYASIAFARP
ncbi:MAG TPA: AmmeMemoRadiSam system protein B [Candidatus Acidoferrales bacterium]|nr:AmmeMemoRadiSam system protein B [Candidatus Acidoferrales bacterium]